MPEFISDDKCFTAYWNYNQQAYHVYYKERFFGRFFRFRDLAPYFD